MRKAIVFSLVSFPLGIAAAITVLVNPFGWDWVKPAHKKVMSTLQPTHTGEGSEDQLWTCGMHPQVLHEGPGDCPICGMALTPLKNSTENQPSSPPEEERKINEVGGSVSECMRFGAGHLATPAKLIDIYVMLCAALTLMR